MKSRIPNPKRVLAIDPTSRGFGFVVLESPTAPVDWGVKTTRPKEEGKALTKVLEVIRHYQPEIIVLEDHQRQFMKDQTDSWSVPQPGSELITSPGSDAERVVQRGRCAPWRLGR